MNLPNKVKIYEVSPRDGLQNEKDIVVTEKKIEFIQLLSQTGLQHIEITSFVSPDWVPQLADHNEVAKHVVGLNKLEYSALVPNLKGFEDAVSTGLKEVAVFTAASNTFTRKNINCSIDESIERFKPVIKLANEHDIKVRAYISCALGCPYEGEISAEQVTIVADQLYQLGCYEICIADTIGVGTALKAQALIQAVHQHIPLENIAVHFHDTYGQALANIFAALQVGITTIDSSVAGLGGCPYAKGASGNVATEDVVYMMNGLGIETGINLEKLLTASRFISEVLHRQPRSKVSLAMK